MSDRLTRKQIAELCGCPVRDIPSAPLYSLTNYKPPGPVGAAYIRSQGPIDVITGPAGSGKTVATIFKNIRFSVGGMPPCNDGVVRVRGTVLRDNYRALYRTTLRSWFEFIPPDYGGALFTGGQDRPAQHVIKLSTVRQVNGVAREIPVDLTVDFFAVGDVAIEELLKGYETTWVWCNEGDLLHPRVIPFAFSRTGRYPALDSLPPGTRRPRVVGVDMNPPDIDHPLWKACETGSFNAEIAASGEASGAESAARTVNFFHQPSGLSPQAENRSGKSYEAYVEESRTLPEEEVRRFVHGQPGYAVDGKPVYLEFDYKRHVAGGTLAVLPNVPLHIGFDQGLSPGAILFQTTPLGQVRVLAELIPDHGTGVSRFLEQLLGLLTGRFRGLPPGVYGADPSGFYGADRIAGEMTWAEAVSKGLGHLVMPAPTNEPVLRIEAVKLLLRTMIDANSPALLVDPSCRLLIGGFAAHYKYRRIRAGSSDRFEDRPYKNEYATAHDSLQYGVLAVRGRAGVINEAAKAGRAGNVVSIGQRPAARPGDFSVWDI
jgi:hypothetical protein